MAADNFFARWSRRKAEASGQSAPPADSAPAPAAAPKGAGTPDDALPLTLADAARLTPESDFAPFLARGVDMAVRRMALKKLFTDPHFNVMDGLDIYIDDYNRFEPLPADMLAKLGHAQSVLNPVPLAPPPAQTPAPRLEADAAQDIATPATPPLPSPPAPDENFAEAATSAVSEETPDPMQSHSEAPSAEGDADVPPSTK